MTNKISKRLLPRYKKAQVLKRGVLVGYQIHPPCPALVSAWRGCSAHPSAPQNLNYFRHGRVRHTRAKSFDTVQVGETSLFYASRVRVFWAFWASRRRKRISLKIPCATEAWTDVTSLFSAGPRSRLSNTSQAVHQSFLLGSQEPEAGH